MNEEVDDNEFYHQDFTTASEWEIFIARIEEIIQEWRNDRSCQPKDKEISLWDIKSENVPFADVDFCLSWYKKSENCNEKDPVKSVSTGKSDFLLTAERSLSADMILSLWYDLNEFLVLGPLGNTGITSESRIKVLLSSIHIVLSNTNCNIPFFIQIREKWQKCYLGVHEDNGIRTSFEMVHLKRGPQHCQYLSGLVDLFKTKIMSPITFDPIVVSVRLTYVLNDFGNFAWQQDPLDPESDNFDSTLCCFLPFGVTVDPVASLVFRTSWSNLPDNVVVDTESYSDFDPLQAAKWSLYMTTSDQPICLLGDCLTEYLHLMNNCTTVYDILGDYAIPPAPEGNNPLDLLTESKVPTISSVLKRATRNSLTKGHKGLAPLSEDTLVPLLYFLFPDADENPTFSYEEPKENENLESENICRHFKTCRIDSLVWRLACMSVSVYHSLGGTRTLAHIWYEFAQEMRYRWEKSILIPGVAGGFPDPRTCLLHQKLQMLNCCIERRKARDANLVSTTTENSSDDEDIFFDAEEEPMTRKKSKNSQSFQPVGRLGKLGDLKLLKTGEQLYIPATQEPVPKTEDQLEEDTDVLLKLGTDAHGSELRARMMSASLLSDMESFKAANPGSVLEDFIRWYSPRDWIEEEGTDEWGQPKGHLSSRMLISDNTWVQMWETAKPVPANRQKRLFDDTREAEKVLHFLDSRNISQIVDLLLPVLLHAVIQRLIDENEVVGKKSSDNTAMLKQLVKTAERLSREPSVAQRRLEIFVQEVTALELKISLANSLHYKFNPSCEYKENVSVFVAKLLSGEEIEIDGCKNSEIGEQVIKLFSAGQKALNIVAHDYQEESKVLGGFPRETTKEVVMKVSAVRPAACSARCPQFLRAIMSKNEFRLCGAFSEDMVFF